ncbi:hypothetical protein L6452_27298 [Arctium lappa]|uniref:Uncharacterized protein n=1 Tax=Arctium lappa TaxID=4217 RepID=A0ACB8ZX00_ARCLA|nr:hypothetical protein L6452_27298 [Arctium lappa]
MLCERSTTSMSRESIPETLNSSLRGSMFTTTRLVAEGLFHEQCSWIWSLVLWTVSDLVLMDRSSGLIIFFLAKGHYTEGAKLIDSVQVMIFLGERKKRVKV